MIERAEPKVAHGPHTFTASVYVSLHLTQEIRWGGHGFIVDYDVPTNASEYLAIHRELHALAKENEE